MSGPKHSVSTVVAAAGSQGSRAGHRDASATSLQPPVQSSGSEEGGGEDGGNQYSVTLLLVLQKVASELHPKVRNHGEGPY